MTTRTGSMDGRMKDTSTYRRYPPERVIIQDLSADFNLNREMADKFCIPTLLDNIHKFESLQETRKPSGTPPYHDPEEDVYRAKIVQGNLRLMKQVERDCLQVEPYSLSIWRWASRFTNHLAEFRTFSSSQDAKMRRYGAQWRLSNAC